MIITNKRKRILSKYLWVVIMLFPLMSGLIIFYFIPFFQNIFYSFTSLGSFGRMDWIGLDNYQRLLNDQEVWRAFRNTFIYTIISVPLIIIFSLIIAQLLNSKVSGTTLYRVLYFLPAVTMPAAIAMMWKWIYNGQYGILNQFLNFLGLEGQLWVTDPDIAMVSLIIVGVWSGLGMNIIYFLAGLQTIPRSYYEAAQIDGAGPIRILLKITLPLLTPTIFFVMITTLISSFQMFDILFMLINRSSMAINSTKTIVYVFYQYAFEFMEKGYAAAISVVLFLLILAITGIQLRLQKKWVHY